MRTRGDLYTVDLLISSEAKRVTQRAKGAWIYLRDENDTHYDPARRFPKTCRWTFSCSPENPWPEALVSRCPRTFTSWAW